MLGWQCSSPQNKQNAYYIYNDSSVFESYSNSNDSLNYLIYRIRSKPIKKYILDSVLIAEDYKSYYLEHYMKYSSYHDSVFYKPKSFLDKIDYFDTEWLKKEDNLDSFWLPASCWRCGGIYDTLNIFIIEPSKHTDSLIFRQVHRWVFNKIE